MKLTKGRPIHLNERLEKEINVYNLLDNLQISYQYADHETANTMDICEKIKKTLDLPICKNLFLCNRQQTQFYLLMMKEDKVFKTKELSNQINCARLSFATAEQMKQYLDITPGSVSVLGLMNDSYNRVRLLIDEDVLKLEYFGCHPCVNTCSLKIKVTDLLEKILPAIHHNYTPIHLEGI